jgi:hypothetical protein
MFTRFHRAVGAATAAPAMPSKDGTSVRPSEESPPSATAAPFNSVKAVDGREEEEEANMQEESKCAKVSSSVASDEPQSVIVAAAVPKESGRVRHASSAAQDERAADVQEPDDSSGKTALANGVRTHASDDAKEGEEAEHKHSTNARQSKRRRIRIHCSDDENEDNADVADAAAAASSLPSATTSSVDALLSWWMDDHQPEATAACPAAVTAATSSPASVSALVATAGFGGSDQSDVLVKLEDIDADPDVRELLNGMGNSIVAYTDEGWNFHVYDAKRKVREARKEAEHQAKMDAAPKRDRPDRRLAAAAASRRLMQQAMEEEEVSEKTRLARAS